MSDLIDPRSGVTLVSAAGINDRGQIVASSGARAYLLTPTAAVPEPSTLALFAVALLGLGAYLRRQQNVFRGTTKQLDKLKSRSSLVSAGRRV